LACLKQSFGRNPVFLIIPNNMQLWWNARDNGVTVFHNRSDYGNRNPWIEKTVDYRESLAGDEWLIIGSRGRSRQAEDRFEDGDTD